ncbi:MAG: D-cysteine desulfhydrase [Candidatus Aegiribacteria sp.]|nr:D-cysteine desulfhydrase [Candidatus Aegiribacteria sp.]
MDLARFPRRRYTSWQTPIEKIERISENIGGPNIYMKRDDLLGLAGGGNKTRKLEFLVADALAQNADTLITCGAPQSNHCRLTLAAARKEGLNCQFILEERIPGNYDENASGNNFLYHLLGVEKIKVVPNGSDIDTEMDLMAEELIKSGQKPYIIPGGGSNPIGALGYAACAEEILAQSFEQGLSFDCLVCASGSAGTHAGLLVGLLGNNSSLPVIGINVSRGKSEQEELVLNLAKQTAEHLGARVEIPGESVCCFDEYVGQGYSLPTGEMSEAVRLMARLEGILLDPVYTGKAFAGLIDLSRKGYFAKNEKVLFLHTGGSPVLFAYMKDVLN